MSALLFFVLLVGLIGVEESTAIHSPWDKSKKTQTYISTIQRYECYRARNGVRNGFTKQIGKSGLMPSIIGNKFVSNTSNNGWGYAWATPSHHRINFLSVDGHSIPKMEGLVGKEREALDSLSLPFWAGFRHAIGRLAPSGGLHTYYVSNQIFLWPYKHSWAFPCVLHIEEYFEKYHIIVNNEIACRGDVNRYPGSFVLSHLVKLPIEYKIGHKRGPSSNGGKNSSYSDYPNRYSVLSGVLALMGVAVLIVGCYCRRDWVSVSLIFIGGVCVVMGCLDISDSRLSNPCNRRDGRTMIVAKPPIRIR